MRRRPIVLSVLVVLSAMDGTQVRADTSRSKDGDDLCLAPFEQGQVHRRGGRLREARDAFRECAAATCPGPVRGDCARWLNELSSAIPTLLVQARDDTGRDVVLSRVLVDAEPVAAYSDGRPFELDPGAHVLRFEADGQVIEQRIVVREGDRDRSIPATFPSKAPTRSALPAAPPPEEPRLSRPIPAAAWALFGVGTVGAGAFATFGYLGWRKHAQLRDSCAPGCSDAQKAPIVTDYAIGDVSLAVAVVSFGVAAVLVLTRPRVVAEPHGRASLAPWMLLGRAGVGGAF
jgi:hypothetical protein